MGEAVGLLHPGEMGARVGAAIALGGTEVLWVSEGRSAGTRKRAEANDLGDAGDLASLLRRSEIVFSVCPPHAALQQAHAVASQRFDGIYVDANAVSPGTTREVEGVVAAAGAEFVDGGIVGPPPTQAGSTRLYLSGRGAMRVAGLFASGPLEAVALDAPVGAASALKMCFAAYTKGTSALLLAVRALARHEGVDEALLAEWGRSLPQLPARSDAAARGTAPKAWRFVGEMREIASTFEAAGLPDGFHRAAAALYERMADFKDADAPELAEVAAALLAGGPNRKDER